MGINWNKWRQDKRESYLETKNPIPGWIWIDRSLDNDVSPIECYALDHSTIYKWRNPNDAWHERVRARIFYEAIVSSCPMRIWYGYADSFNKCMR